MTTGHAAAKAKTKAGAKPRPKAKAKAKVATRKPAKPAPTTAAAPRRPGPRADLGAPVDGFFARQPAHLKPVLDQLRAMVGQAAPDAASSIKWGMPFYTIGANTLCALASFKSHINLILPGPPGTYADPDGRLEGGGKTGKHLKVRSLDDLPRAAVREWLRTAAERARS